jgi:hypothetical protein
VLKAQGSFFIGGEQADETEGQLGTGPAGHIAINEYNAVWCRKAGTAMCRS